MGRRTIALAVLTLAAACGRGSGTATLERDDAIVRPGDQAAASRTTALLESATAAAARGDSETARLLVSDADAEADEDPALVYEVALVGERIGDGPNAAMSFRHYLVLAPDGPHAADARSHADALMLGSSSAPSQRRAPGLPTTHEVPALPARSMVLRSRTTFRTNSASHLSHARSSRGRLVLGRGRATDRSEPIRLALRDTTVSNGVVDRAPSVDSATAPSPAAVASRSRVGRRAILGASTGAMIGAVFGRGVRSTVAGMVLGGAVGAATASRAGSRSR